jgi:hypothetical protein
MQGVEAGKGIAVVKAAQGKMSQAFVRAGREIEDVGVDSRFLWEAAGTRRR